MAANQTATQRWEAISESDTWQSGVNWQGKKYIARVYTWRSGGGEKLSCKFCNEINLNRLRQQPR